MAKTDLEKAQVVNNRRVINGSEEGMTLMMLHPVKHSWASELLLEMQNNAWHQNEVDLSEDAKQYALDKLTGGELKAYKKALSFLSNLDGIQLNNITRNINKHITSPEISMCLVRQAWEEAQHLLSYNQIITSIGFDPTEIFWAYEEDEQLANKNQYILQSSQLLGNNFTTENFIKSIVANVALEGVYFYSGFLVFFALERLNLMRGSAKMVQFILRDEETHLKLFTKLWGSLKEENSEVFTQAFTEECREIIRLAVEHEVMWAKWIISECVLGLTDVVVEQFIQHLGNERLEMLGLQKLYKVTNPVKWFDDYSSITNGKSNFFESKNAAYLHGALEWD